MIAALESRGYEHGSGVWNPDSTKFLVNIPKNASSFMLGWANHHGWLAGNISDFSSANEILIVLRDPMDRWISGIAQYINGFILNVHGPNGPIFPGEPTTDLDYSMTAEQFSQQYTDVVERLIFDIISRFDDHVWPQCEIVEGLPDCRKTWFFLDSSLESKISSYLGWQVIPGLDKNRSDDVLDIKTLQNFFRHRLQMRPELEKRVRDHYKKDYELISRVIHD